MTLPMTVSGEAYLSMLFQIIVGIRDRLDPKMKNLKPLTLKAAKADLMGLNPNLVLNSKTIKEAVDELNTKLKEIEKEYEALKKGKVDSNH